MFVYSCRSYVGRVISFSLSVTLYHSLEEEEVVSVHLLYYFPPDFFFFFFFFPLKKEIKGKVFFLGLLDGKGFS